MLSAFRASVWPRATTTDGTICVLEPASGRFSARVAVGQCPQAAVDRVSAGGSILLLPGVHTLPATLRLDREVHVFGRGAAVLCLAEGVEGDVVSATAGSATLDGVHIRKGVEASEGGHFGVLVTDGRLRLQACDVESLSQSCVCVRGAGSAPTLTGCTLHEAYTSSGLIFCEGARGAVLDSHLLRNGYGVTIASGANPRVSGNRIHDSAHAGVYACDVGTLGRLEDNDIYENVLAGVVMGTGARPTVYGNKVHGMVGAGIVIVDAGTEGVLEKNDIYGNEGGLEGPLVCPILAWVACAADTGGPCSC